MRRRRDSNLICLAVSVCLTGAALAQPPGRGPGEGGERPGFGGGRPQGGPGGFGGPGGPGGLGGRQGGPPSPEMMMRMMPVLAALDANKDGVISMEEINNATAALKALDKNKDGDLTEEEMRPDFSAFRGRAGQGRGGSGRPPEEGRGGFGPPPEGGPGGRPAGRGPGGDQAGRGGPGRAMDSSGSRSSEMVDRMMGMDRNGDGKLSKSEVGERMQGLITRADRDKDGFVTREELVGMSGGRGVDPRGVDPRGGDPRGGEREAGRQGGDPGEFFARMFEQRDKNEDGKLSPDEMPEQMRGRLEQIDTDKDGSVSRKEMESMMSRLRQRGPQGGRGGDPAGRAGGDVPRRPPIEE